MVIMALDHVRDFFAPHADPMDMATTTPLLFATRWITHLCAPTFVFLAGTAAYLKGQRSTRGELVAFLWKRGLWLVFLEIAVARIVWLRGHVLASRFPLQVIWAIGISMIFLAGLVAARLSLAAITIVGGLLVVGHNLWDGLQLGPLWRVLHEPGGAELGPIHVFVMYPLVPWLGVIALGYAFGAICDRPRRVLQIGLGALAAFVVIRVINVYGDTLPWSVQPRGPLYMFFSFLNLRKYPPSLDYLLCTLGVSLITLALLDLGRVQAKAIAVFGRVPLFYYLLHLYAILCWSQLPALQVSLPWIYPLWLALVAMLYPPCWWFDRLKQRRRDLWWLGYL
jgi:uncharacterized membrane protein